MLSIAITVLVLEFKVPYSDGVAGPRGLWTGLFDEWPSLFAYVLSFVTIGVYFARHHYLFMLYEKADHTFVLLNLLFLMCVSFLPYPTKVLAAHLRDPSTRGAAATFYAIGLALPAASWTLMWLYAVRGRRLVDGRLHETFIRLVTVQYVGTVLLFLAAAVASHFSAKLGLGTCVGLTLLYLLPPPRPSFAPKPL